MGAVGIGGDLPLDRVEGVRHHVVRFVLGLLHHVHQLVIGGVEVRRGDGVVERDEEDVAPRLGQAIGGVVRAQEVRDCRQARGCVLAISIGRECFPDVIVGDADLVLLAGRSRRTWRSRPPRRRDRG